MDWNKMGAIGSLVGGIFATATFGWSIWPWPQIRAHWAQSTGQRAIQQGVLAPKLIGLLLVISFVLSAIAIYGAWRKNDPLHWTMRQDQEQVIYGQIYRNQDVEIDGKRFDHCKFENVTFIYHALAPCDLLVCEISGSVLIKTDNDAAKGILKFVEALRALPNVTKFGIASIDSKGNIVPFPDPIVKTP
jgi:hypothetical protein